MKYVHLVVQEVIQKGRSGLRVIGSKEPGRGRLANRRLGHSAEERVRPEYLECIARLSVRGKNVTIRAGIDFASALLTTNVPNARDDVTVLTFTESGATTTVIEVDEGIDTLVITADQAGDRASRATLGARGKIAGAEVSLLGINALVVVTVVVPSIVVTPSILVIVAVRSLGWSRRLCGVGRSRGRVATESGRAPAPAFIALRRGEGIR